MTKVLRQRLGDGWLLIARMVREERALFVTTVALTLLGAVLEGIGVGLLVPFLESMLDPGREPFQVGVGWIDTNVLAIHGTQMERLYRISAFLLGTMWLRAVVLYLSNMAGIKLGERVGHRLRVRMVDQLQSVSLGFFANKRSGELLNTMLWEISRVIYILGIIRTYLVNVSMMAAYGGTLFFLSWKLSLFALAFCALLMGAGTAILRRLRGNGDQITASSGRLTAVAADLIAGNRTIIEFGTQEREAERFRQVSEDHLQLMTRVSAKSQTVPPLSQGIGSTALVLIVAIAVQFFVLPGAMTAASLIAFVVALLRLLPNLQTINNSRAEWSIYSGSVNAVSELLSRRDKAYLKDGDRPLPQFSESIELRDLSFEYEPGQPVLKGINLRIERGQTVAFIGGSGAGKSTLVDVIARFYDPTSGQVMVDGQELRDYRISDLRKHIAVVNQQTYLFNDSIRANISYGLDNVSEAEVRDAARKANALEFIDEMPDGFETVLGERGARLSGGQRQRIAIARAILRNPEILILDEATSALDTVSERLIQEALEYLMRDRTVLVIAHRLSTIENADRVVVLEQGRVAEEGAYDDLLEQRGQLWQYHSLQFQTAPALATAE